MSTYVSKKLALQYEHGPYIAAVKKADMGPSFTGPLGSGVGVGGQESADQITHLFGLMTSATPNNAISSSLTSSLAVEVNIVDLIRAQGDDLYTSDSETGDSIQTVSANQAAGQGLSEEDHESGNIFFAMLSSCRF